jgi:hypothetical protein
MYISHQGLQAVHQDKVNDALRRYELRRKLREQEAGNHEAAARRNFGTPLTVLGRVVRTAASRSRHWTLNHTHRGGFSRT